MARGLTGRAARGALAGMLAATAFLGACSDDGPPFTFSIRLELTPDVTSVTADGSPLAVRPEDGAPRFIELDRSFVDYQAGKNAAPVMLETYAGSALLHQGQSAVGNCERDCRSFGNPGCPTPATITKELVALPPDQDFGVRDYVLLECGNAMYTITGPPIP